MNFHLRRAPVLSCLGGACQASSTPNVQQWTLNSISAVKALEENGEGRVLVVDGGGSMRCALLGDNIAEMAYKNGWSVSALIFHFIFLH